MNDRPDILLVTTDTQRCDSIAAYGHPAACSPHLDRLAAEGLLFEDCRSPHPVCGPARSCLLTGQYACCNGALENGVERRPGTPTFPDALRQAGYHTIMVGKTHFGPEPDFAEAHVLRGEKNHERDDFYAAQVRALGFSRRSAHPNPVPPEHFVDACCVDRTIDCLRRAPSDRPAFAFCSLLSPHGPLDPPGTWATRFAGQPLPDEDHPPTRLASEAAPIRELLGFDPARSTPGEQRQARELYYGLCGYVDQQLGRLFAYLEESGRAANTLVIVTSDHGMTRFAEGGQDKHCFRPSSWRVPLLLRWPGRIPPGSRGGLASWTDLTATILAAAGAPAAWVQGFDLLAGDERTIRHACVGSLCESLALATTRWTYEWHPQTDEEHLFDRHADPWEQQDLASSGAHAMIRQQAFRALATWRALIVDLHDLQGRLSGGGPVAERVTGRYRSRHSADADRCLSDWGRHLDTLAVAPA